MLCGKRIVAVVQARMGSSRLPGKSLEKIAGKTLLARVIERTKLASNVDEIVVATSNQPQDDSLAQISHGLGVRVYRGDESDVLRRIFDASVVAAADVVVRVCADNPLLDIDGMEKAAQAVACKGYDYATNAYAGGAPPGTVSEAISFSSLREANARASTPREREHVTTYVREGGRFRKFNVPVPAWLGRKVILCVDTKEDLEFSRKLFSKVEVGSTAAGLRRAVEFAQKHRPQTIALLVEARRERGIGHLMRSMAVARELKREKPGSAIVFLVNSGGPGKKIAAENGFEAHEVKFDAIGVPDAGDCAKAVQKIGADIVVTDVFGLDAGIAKQIIPSRASAVAMDDVGNRKIHADLVVNPTIVPQWHDYPANNDFPGQKVLAGAQYMPVRGQVAELKGKRKLHKDVEKILVTMGGGDEYSKTLVAVAGAKAALDGSRQKRARVLVLAGAAFSPGLVRKLEQFAGQDRRFTLLKDGSKLAALMREADILVNSGGVTMYEGAFLGIPQVVIPRHPEIEAKAAKEFEKKGAVLVAHTRQEAAKQLEKLFSRSARRKTGRQGRLLVDGKGSERIAKAISQE